MIDTQDPHNHLMGGPIPALTTLLIKVCDNNAEKFDEAMRLVTLFLEKQQEKFDGKMDISNT